MASYNRRAHEADEIDRALREAKEIRAAPLADRKEARDAFFEAMRDEPRRIGEQVSWLFNGSYGQGVQLLALRILHSPRMNRVAALTQMVGLYNWRCPEDMTRQAVAGIAED